MAYRVKAVAQMANVTIRTLHHYDAIGLLSPSACSPAGYRLYDEADLERLQAILFFRELDMPLMAIKALFDRPEQDRTAILETHRMLLLDKRNRLDALLAAVDRSLDAIERSKPMKPEVLFEVFDSPEREQMESYDREARERWGDEAIAASYERVKHMTRADWQAHKAEQNAAWARTAAMLPLDPASSAAQEVAAALWTQIDSMFYRLTPEIFRGLGVMYVEDPRFRANYDAHHPDLAAFMRDAMAIYADTQEGRQAAGTGGA